MVGLMELEYDQKRSIVFMMAQDFEHIKDEELMMCFMPILAGAQLYRNWTGPDITIVPAVRLAMHTWREVRLEAKRSYDDRTRSLERRVFSRNAPQHTYDHAPHENPEEAACHEERHRHIYQYMCIQRRSDPENGQTRESEF